MSHDIKDRLKSIIENYIDEDEIDVNQEILPDSHIIEDLGLDSFYVIDMIIDIENEFEITIDNDTIMTLGTIQSVIDLISEKLQEK